MNKTENWRPIPRAFPYEASDFGNIRRGPFSKTLRPCKNKNGYLYVVLSFGGRETYVTKTVHNLVANAFHGDMPLGCEIAHNDGIKDNNVPLNLRYATKEENAYDRWDHGTMLRTNAKISDFVVRIMKRLSQTNMPHGEIASIFNVHRTTALRAINGEHWSRPL